MIVAESKLCDTSFVSKSYFGDASWDKKAAEKFIILFLSEVVLSSIKKLKIIQILMKCFHASAYKISRNT